ncbi:RHS repeat protein [Salmonella enterica]|nr:RHS repeat protein [Salmonella enterica]
MSGNVTGVTDGAGTETYEQSSVYNLTGQLQSQHLNHPQLNREYGYDEGGRLVRISGPQQTREYRYSESGRLTGVHTSAENLDITLPYATDPAGNRLPDPEFYPDSASTVWADNRITEDMQYLYRYDKYGRLTEKTDRIPEGVVIRMNDERTHRYEYDNQHRLVHYVRTQHGETQAEGRYLYDPLGRRVGKRVWKRELVHWSDTRMELSRRPYVTWYGWEGDRLTTIQTGQSRIQTVYAPGSFTPLVRIETDAAEQAKTQHRSLAEKLSQEGSEDGQAVQLPAALTVMLDRLESELRRNAVSEESRAWLAGCGLTPEQMAEQLEPEYTPQRKIHLYHCDQRGLPLALITPDNTVAWRGEYDEWGNLSGEENPADLEQVIRLPGQQYDEESGLYYNRYRYYNPGQGRYITQDPIGLKGGLNPYQYPLNPVTEVDPLGLWAFAIPAILEGINWLFWGSAAAGGTVLATSGDSEQSKTKTEHLAKCEEKKPCPPCKTISGNIVPRGTIGYRHDLVPPGKPHHPYTGDHYNLYKANQNPNNCQCFWKESGAADAANGLPPPTGSIPIEPFAP